jgi:hypothetical protein
MKRRRARDLSPEFLYTISGIGPKGRIRKKGVDAYKARTMTNLWKYLGFANVLIRREK